MDIWIQIIDIYAHKYIQGYLYQPISMYTCPCLDFGIDFVYTCYYFIMFMQTQGMIKRKVMKLIFFLIFELKQFNLNEDICIAENLHN